MRSSNCLSFRNHFREYCNRSSIHGCQYIGEKARPYPERFWWGLVFVTSLTACAYSIYQVYRKWEQSPVIVNLSNGATPIYTIPFPAVTICSESKFDYVKYSYNLADIVLNVKEQPPKTTEENITRVLNNPTMNQTNGKSQELPKMEIFGGLISSVIRNISKATVNHTNAESDAETLEPEFHLENCKLWDTQFDCDSEFMPIVTEGGTCYTFNMLDRNEIFKDNVYHRKHFHQDPRGRSSNWTLVGYRTNAPVETYPRRALLAGAKDGLKFHVLTSKKLKGPRSGNRIDGYRITLHTPVSIPRPDLKYFRVSLDKNVVGTILPNVITTSKRIQMYKPEDRNCYFETEHPLKYFRNYTASNCELECISNYTLETCGCVNDFMPRENGTPVCGTSETERNCTRAARKIMQIADLTDNIDDSDLRGLANNSSLPNLKCNCLPDCSDLSYDVDSTQVDWKWGFKDYALQISRNILQTQYHRLSLTLFFPSKEFFSSERNELYGPTDFLANFGGLLGLFTGFSLLSLAEILYFCTIRLLCNKWAKGAN